VTENVTKTVPVSHEEVRVEREPITDANVGAAKSVPDISEEEHEVVLREERPVVEKDVVPTERVRLTKETSTHDETVSGEVRKEQVDTDEDSSDGKHRQGRGGVEGGDRTSRQGERRDQGQGKPPVR
jgi:stress response protein YsnF